MAIKTKGQIEALLFIGIFFQLCQTQSPIYTDMNGEDFIWFFLAIMSLDIFAKQDELQI